MNICVQCRWCSTGALDRVWYDYTCRAPRFRPIEVVDPVTGKRAYQHTNDLGGRHMDTERQSPHCRTINKDGHCEEFSPLHVEEPKP